jgi:hypothetical protein
LPFEDWENCPKMLTAPSRFFRVWAEAVWPSQGDAVRRKGRRKKERDRDRMNISLPTLLRMKRMEIAGTSSFNPKR